MSDRDELKIIVLAHIRRFGDEAGFHNHCSQKKNFISSCKDGGNIQNKRHFSQPQK
jgi:hypothetical protein